jgi:hypothetical protein
MQIDSQNIYVTKQLNSSTGDGNRFSARPLKQWRKQYQAPNNGSVNYRCASIGMPMDRPGGLVPVATSNIRCTTCKATIPAKVVLIKDSACTTCQPIINNVRLSDTAYTNNQAYLQSRCATYEQKLGTDMAPGINYFSDEGIPLEPSDSPTGPQIRASVNCFRRTCPAAKTTIYKPNNTPYAQQGGVSSSSRLARLKYNTLNNSPVNRDGSIYNGSVFNTAAGAEGVNSGRYQVEPSPSYFTKYKPQQVFYPRKTGTRVYCTTADTICQSE